MKAQIDFPQVRGYKTYANAVKRGDQVAKAVRSWLSPDAARRVRYVVIAQEDGRFIPAFVCSDKVGPQNFLGMTNVCTFN